MESRWESNLAHPPNSAERDGPALSGPIPPMTYFPRIDRWHIPEAALQASFCDIAIPGREGNEGTCLWLGTKDDNQAFLTHVVFLRGHGVRNTPENVEISAELMRDVHDHAMERGVILIGQIHSHGPFYGVNLSPVDHKYGVRAPYFLSVVCPDYGQRERM